MMQQRLQKILSACGVASRRAAEKLIEQGLVTVNGTPAELGMCADPQEDTICVRGVPIALPVQYTYIALNKPRGYVTTMHDEQGRKSVDVLVKDVGVRVYPVGRLDMDSEGLLLLTNDGEFANMVAHPSAGKEKIYHVTVRGDVDASLAQLQEPFELDGYITRPARVTVLKRKPDGGVLSVCLHEGRNRQVRRMCALCGLTVLPTGAWRHLTAREIASVMHK